MKYKARALLKPDRTYSAEFQEGFTIIAQRHFTTPEQAIAFLNKYIERVNLAKGIAIPALHFPKQMSVEYESEVRDEKAEQTTKAVQQAVEKRKEIAENLQKKMRETQENRKAKDAKNAAAAEAKLRKQDIKQGENQEAKLLKNNETENVKQEIPPAKRGEEENKLGNPEVDKFKIMDNDIQDNLQKTCRKESQHLQKSEVKTKPTTKPKAPKRKPFTPYGLNGYFVDNQGNIRLMLDRKASAKIITLTSDMFEALAEMVKKTQTQQQQQQHPRSGI